MKTYPTDPLTGAAIPEGQAALTDEQRLAELNRICAREAGKGGCLYWNAHRRDVLARIAKATRPE
jgi:hypothetical protein